MPCKIEIRKTIDQSILDQTENDFQGFTEKKARGIAVNLNSLWGNIASVTQSTGEGGWRIITSRIPEAVDREYIKQSDAEKSFERDLDFFNNDQALYEQEQKEPLLQLRGRTETSAASPKTIATIKTFLKAIGVNINTMDEIVVNGVKQDAKGAALLMQKLIQVVDGEDASALPEEAMHFAVEIIKQTNPKLYNQLLKEINNYQLYYQVLADYSTNPLYQTKDGKPNIQKLKDEAIAKVLVETVIKRNGESTEKPENLVKVQGWWRNMIDWFKGLFIKSGFDKAAMDVISGKAIGTAEDIRAEQGDVYLQQAGKSRQDVIFDSIKDMISKIDKRSDGYYINNKKITRRVTDEAKTWYDRIFADKKLTDSEYTQEVNKLKADKGTDGHKDIEYAFDLFVDADGYLKSKDEMDAAIENDAHVSFLNENDSTMYITLRDNLRQRLESFPEGTRFMAEAIVYDAKRDIAGTVDFLAITPEGKTSILDWKFMAISDKYTEIPWFKVKGWRIQMDQYKQIISQVYGVSNQDFEQTRMIPIKAEYSEGNVKKNIKPILTGVEIGGVNVLDIEEDYLLPVALETEKTESEDIDRLLVKLNSIYKKISEKKVSPEEKKAKSEQLNKLFSAIRQLQMRKNIKPLIEQAGVLNKQIKKVIATYNEKFKGQNPKSFSQDEINEFSGILADNLAALDTYVDLDAELGFLFEEEDELSEDDEATRDALAKASYNAKKLKIQLVKADLEFTDKIIGGSEDVKNLSSGEKIVKGLNKWFGTTASIQLKGLEVLFKKANRAFGFAGMDTLTETKKLLKLKEAYQKWANSKGLTVRNMFDIIKKKDSNELIDQYDPKFYSELKKKIQDKDYAWIRNNIDVEAYREELNKKKKEELDRINNRLENEEITEAEANGLKAKNADLYSTSTPESIGWLLYNDAKKFPVKDWYSPEWKNLTAKGNEAAKDFYDYIIERNNYYQSIGYLSGGQARTFLPWVRKGLAEKLVFGGKVSMGEQFLRNISMDEGDVGFGQRDPLSGKLIDKIPVYFTREIEGEVSTDLFKTMSVYNEMAIKFKYLSDIEEQGRALIRLENNKEAISTSYFGKTEYIDGVLQHNPDNSENAKIIEDMVKGIIYQQRFLQSETFDQILGTFGKFGEKLNNKLGFKMLPENLDGRQVSINKVISQINRTFQLNALGLNVLSSMSNFFGGSAQSWINAGTYFTKSEFVSTEMWILGQKMTGLDGLDKTKAIAALEYFLPLTENYGREIAKKLSVSKLTQDNVQDFMMVLMRNSDKAVQTANFFSYLRNSIVENGEVVNAREFLKKSAEYANFYEGTSEQRAARAEKFEKDVKELIEQKGVIKLGSVVDGEFIIPGVERKSESIIALRRKVQQISSDALGSLTEENKRLINLNIYGNSFMVFKNWIPRLVDVRMGNLKYNSASDAYEWGRTRMIYRIISEDLLGSLGNLTNALQANDKGVAYMRELFEKKAADYKKDTGKDLEMTESEFMDLVRKNIRNQMYDLMVYLTLIAAFAALKANAPDDDEDPIVKNQYKFFLKATDKFKDEIGYFYDPTSLTKLVSTGIFPSLGLIDNYKKVLTNFLKENYYLTIGDEEAADKNYVLKYVMRSIPTISSLSSYLPMFFPDLAKDLDIKMPSRSGIR
jgi:hypothetical protein